MLEMDGWMDVDIDIYIYIRFLFRVVYLQGRLLLVSGNVLGGFKMHRLYYGCKL